MTKRIAFALYFAEAIFYFGMLKKILGIMSVGLCLAVALKAQDINISPENKEQEIPAKSVIRGRIVYEGTDQPVRRGSLGLLDIKEFVNDSASNISHALQDIYPNSFVLTDDNGEFEIKNVKAGSYYPFVNVPNVLNPQSINKYYGTDSTISATKLDSFFQKITVDGISEIQVLIGVKRGAAISGRVFYSDGSPAISVKVKIFRSAIEQTEDKFVSIKNLETDDRGYYRLTELPPGKYYVEIAEPSVHKGEGNESDYPREFTRDSELKTYFPNASDIKRAEPISLDWGQEQTDVDITIPDRRLFKVSGVVIAKDTKKPIENIRVRFQKIDEENGVDFYGANDTHQVFSDPRGNWSFKDLPKGKYRLEITPHKYLYYYDEEETRNEEPYAESVKEIEIVDKELKDIIIELPLEGVVSGTVVVEGKKALPTSMDIYVIDDKRKIFGSRHHRIFQNKEKDKKEQTQWDFRIRALSEGSYSFQVRVDGDFYVKSIKLGTADLANSSLELKESQHIENVLVVLASDVGKLHGVVFEGKDKPAQMVTVLLVPVESAKQKGNNFYFNGHTNSKGEFVITAAPGEYFVTIPKRENNKLSEEGRLKKITKDAEKVTIKPNETKNISLILPNQ